MRVQNCGSRLYYCTRSEMCVQQCGSRLHYCTRSANRLIPMAEDGEPTYNNGVRPGAFPSYG